MSTSPPPVTVVVPCFNEAAGLPMLLGRLETMRQSGAVRDWRFIFVDDGSTDETFTELLRAVRHRTWIQVLRHHDNLGLGAALRTGLAHTESPIVCTIDSDCTYPPERLPELTGLIEQGADIATASAWHPASQASEGSRLRLLLSRRVSGVYRHLIGQEVHTFTCLFRAYRRAALARIDFRADGFAAVAEIMLKAILANFDIREVPIELGERRFGASKLQVGDAVLAHARLIALTTFTVGARRARQAVGR